MTRRELQDLLGVEIGLKTRMIVGPDGTIYGRCEDESWEPYLDETRDIPVTPEEDAAWTEREG